MALRDPVAHGFSRANSAAANSIAREAAAASQRALRVSPDGRKLALWRLVPTDSADMDAQHGFARNPATDGNRVVSTELFWSPDSRFVGFDAGQIWRRLIFRAPSGNGLRRGCGASRRSWNKDGVIIFADSVNH